MYYKNAAAMYKYIQLDNSPNVPTRYVSGYSLQAQQQRTRAQFRVHPASIRKHSTDIRIQGLLTIDRRHTQIGLSP